MMKSHNWFGFKVNNRGYMTGQVRKGYGFYASPDNTLKDYQEWEAATIQRHGLYSEQQFRDWLPGHYATDPAYARKIQQALTQIHKHDQ